MAKKQAASGQTEEAVQKPAASVEANVSESPVPAAPKPAMDSSIKQGHAPVGSKAEMMRQKLAAEPKVRILIPLANGEKPGVTQSVILNGYAMYIRKGDYVNVPESVAEVLETKMKHKMTVE